MLLAIAKFRIRGWLLHIMLFDMLLNYIVSAHVKNSLYLDSILGLLASPVLVSRMDGIHTVCGSAEFEKTEMIEMYFVSRTDRTRKVHLS